MGMVTAITLFWSNKPNPATRQLPRPLPVHPGTVLILPGLPGFTLFTQMGNIIPKWPLPIWVNSLSETAPSKRQSCLSQVKQLYSGFTLFTQMGNIIPKWQLRIWVNSLSEAAPSKRQSCLSQVKRLYSGGIYGTSPSARRAVQRSGCYGRAISTSPMLLDPCGLTARFDPPVVPSGPFGVPPYSPACPPVPLVSLRSYSSIT
jgi:hypothetical protein